MQKVDDPSATYRGYRRQALYCLFRLFEDGLPENYILQPEGIEDLAIFDASGVLLEVVQVKDYSSPLVASDFTSFLVNSSNKCITQQLFSIHAGQLAEHLVRCLEPQTLPWSVVEFMHSFQYLSGRHVQQPHCLGEVLA